MTAYALSPVSWDSNSLNDASYVSWFDPKDNVLGTVVAQSIDVDQPFSHPKTVGTQKQGKAYPLHIRIVAGVDETKLYTLKKWFASSQTQKYLRVTNGAGTTLRVACVSRGLLASDNPVEWIANLWADDGALEADALSTDTHNACSGDTHDLSHTSGGNAPPSGVFTIHPNTVKDRAHGPAFQVQRIFATKCANPLTDPNGDGWPLLIMDNWNTAALVTASKALASGNDLRVWIDGIEVDRWFGTGAYDWNQTTTKVWVNVPFPSRYRAQLNTALTTSPTDIESVEANGFANWPPSGYVQMGDASGEVRWYGSRTNNVLSATAVAQKSTAVATHAANIYLYRLPHDIRMTYGWTGADAPPSSADKAPIFDRSLSDNTHFTWPGYYYSLVKQTAQFTPSNKPLNSLSPLLTAYVQSFKMRILDSPPSAGFNQGDLWYFRAPTGIGAIEQDIVVPPNMLLNVWGSDGVADKLLESYNPDTDGTGLSITPAAPVYDVRYEGMVRTVTAAEPTAIAEDAYSLLDSRRAEQFTLDSVTTLTGIIVKLKRDGSATGYITAQIWLPQSGATGPEPANTMIYLGNAITVSDIGNGSYTEHLITFPTPITIPAGSNYYLNLERTTAPGNIWWQHGTGCYAKGSLWSKGGGTWVEHPEFDFWFRLLGDGTICQPEVQTGTDGEVTIDNVRLTLTNVWGTIPAGAEYGCHLCDATIRNDTTGKTISILLPMDLGQTLTIDTAARTAILTGNGESVLYGVTFPEGDFFAPGANVISYNELGMANTDLTLAIRDRFE